MIFIEWNDVGDEDCISQFSKDFGDGKSLEMTKIRLTDYSLLYEALLENKNKYRTNLLRNLKKDIYDLVLTNKPGTKMRVVGLEEDDKLEEVEVVIGVGILSEFGKKGYSSIKPNEIYEDIVFDNRDLNPRLVVEESLPTLLKFYGNSIPINKYISQYDGELDEQIKKEIKTEFRQLLNNTIEKEKNRGRISETTVHELRDNHSDLKCLEYIPLLDFENIDENELKEFLVEFMTNRPNFLDTNTKTINKTNFRRIIKIYDWIKYYYNNKECPMH